MELKPGYKQTEVGVIPEEWEAKRLSRLAEIRGGIAKNSNVEPVDPISVHYLRVANVQDGFLDLSEMSNIHLSRHDLPRYKVLPGDVLMNEGGDLDKLGRGAIWRGEFDPCVHQNHVFVVRCKAALLPEYLNLWTATSASRRFFLLAGKQTTNLASISKSSLGELPVALPPLSEQRAIAAALSDVDGLLGGLDRLIAKKRDLKQAAMQQLLTGQTRLPGFHGEWEETTLGQVGECIIGLTYKPENVVEHGLLVLRSSNVQNGRLAYDDNVHVNLQVAEHLYTQLGDILVCVRNGSRALIGKCAAIDSSAVGVTFGAFMSVYRTKHWRYVLHAFQGDGIQRQIRDNIGATINQITNKDMKAFRLRLPPKAEQTAIAEVLTEMDAELTALEQRREKTHALKQAMMQELLTGRTRLV
jgi:type I restriction enzyme S subunit